MADGSNICGPRDENAPTAIEGYAGIPEGFVVGTVLDVEPYDGPHTRRDGNLVWECDGDKQLALAVTVSVLSTIGVDLTRGDELVIVIPEVASRNWDTVPTVRAEGVSWYEGTTGRVEQGMVLVLPLFSSGFGAREMLTNGVVLAEVIENTVFLAISEQQEDCGGGTLEALDGLALERFLETVERVRDELAASDTRETLELYRRVSIETTAAGVTACYESPADGFPDTPPEASGMPADDE